MESIWSSKSVSHDRWLEFCLNFSSICVCWSVIWILNSIRAILLGCIVLPFAWFGTGKWRSQGKRTKRWNSCGGGVCSSQCWGHRDYAGLSFFRMIFLFLEAVYSLLLSWNSKDIVIDRMIGCNSYQSSPFWWRACLVTMTCFEKVLLSIWYSTSKDWHWSYRCWTKLRQNIPLH